LLQIEIVLFLDRLLEIMGLFNFVTGMLTGFYAGVYIAQNYNVPAVSDPGSLLERAKKFLEDNKKD